MVREVDGEIETAAALHQRGNDAFGRGDHREALRQYAAALAKLEVRPGSQGAEAKRAATLRSNRALCCLKLDKPMPEIALQEAEKCQELRPDWPKAHYRKASAFEALGRLGDARLALCYARRLAPMDLEVNQALEALRARLFGSDAYSAAARVGAALDSLEDFEAAPEDTRDAAAELKALLLPSGSGDAAGGEVIDPVDPAREGAVRAFVEAKGADTLFRRQNAMGNHWKEECKNGTMSMLSEVARATPQLEQELVVVNQRADARELGEACKDSVLGCHELPRKGPPPPPQPGRRARRSDRADLRAGKARPLSAAFGELGSSESGEEEEGKVVTIPPPAAAASTYAVEVPAKPMPMERAIAPAAIAAASQSGAEPLRASLLPCSSARSCWQALALAFLPPSAPMASSAAVGPSALRRFGACAGASRAWAAGARAVREEEEFISLGVWTRWADARWPGIADSLSPSVAGGHGSIMLSPSVIQQLLRPASPAAVGSSAEFLLSSWTFVIEVLRDDRSLWRAALGSANLLSMNGGQGCNSGATLYERVDVVMPGDCRRLAIAGVVEALGAAAKARIVPEGHSADIRAIHAPSGRILTLPSLLVSGSRHSLKTLPAKPLVNENHGMGYPLCVVAGISKHEVSPGLRIPHPAGSLEVRLGLGFLGADGGWLPGGGVALAGMLEVVALCCAPTTSSFGSCIGAT
mmetsp:Transcript_31765/g.83539  ORF Transcript_31765/g.83539 Transcript_31765/m.83539 type:complete len:698 (+) Transcript_31765:67-2160(+)